MVSKYRSRRFFACTFACGLWLVVTPARGYDQKVNSATKPVPRAEKWWTDRHQGFVELAKKGNIDVLFVGDSITQAWGREGKKIWTEQYAPLKAANFGISGDQTQHVIWRLREGKELTGINPKVVVLMIGTNNMGRNNSEEIAEGITAIAHELTHQLPQSKILLLGIFPRRPSAGDPARAKIKDVNQRIAKLDDGKHVRYLDIGEKFLESDGTLTKEVMPDFLHLTPKGYKIWADAMLR